MLADIGQTVERRQFTALNAVLLYIAVQQQAPPAVRQAIVEQAKEPLKGRILMRENAGPEGEFERREFDARGEKSRSYSKRERRSCHASRPTRWRCPASRYTLSSLVGGKLNAGGLADGAWVRPVSDRVWQRRVRARGAGRRVRNR